jgi:hypothetical protein
VEDRAPRLDAAHVRLRRAMNAVLRVRCNAKLRTMRPGPLRLWSTDPGRLGLRLGLAGRRGANFVHFHGPRG